ncbi:MAG: hypothetical protein A2086_14810 [Spirochaetes bacterium GWD1_27_9]|nr:MAG: hypothetical protein A2Y34_12005 [Spirochaetes bacterium GWC1_27_15]OHD45364.1 MAG: hypothetical protein A2086_14810 [Spirochaetes bacterium GWD1_27_9]
MHETKKWIINGEKQVFKSKIFEIYQMDCFLPSKYINNDFYSIHLTDWVNIFAITEDNKVLLVKQHRLGKNIVTYEVPAGAIDKNEDPQFAAIRELEEETGYTTDKIVLLKKIAVNPAIQNNTCYFYLALDCKKTKDTDFDTTEELDLVIKDKEELFNCINTDLIDNSLALMSVMFAKEYLSGK